MPSRAPPRNGGLDSSSDFIRDGVEFRRTRYQPSRFAREKPLSPRADQSLKFKDKGVRAENPICPPNADLPFEIVKTADKGYLVQSKNQSDQLWRNTSKEDELIRYMSKVPGYLQKGDKVQGNILNFGVLDWGRLEKWTNKQSRSSGKAAKSSNASSIPSGVAKKEASAGQTDSLNSSHATSVRTIGLSPVVRPLKEKAVKQPQMGASLDSFMNKKQAHSRRDELKFTEGLDLKSVEGKEKVNWQESRRKDESQVRIGVDVKRAKGKEKCSSNDRIFFGGARSLNLSDYDSEVLGSSEKNVSNQGTEQQKATKKVEGRGLDNPDQHCSGEQESIVLLLPKDFSRPSSSEVSQRASVDGKSAQHNWGSFSDIFSVDEVHLDESFSDIQQSCFLKNNVETEIELDTKLDNLIKAQGVDLQVNPPDVPSRSKKTNVRAEAISSTALKATDRAEQRAPCSSIEMNRDNVRQQRFSFDIGRLTRSLSFKESSACPPMSSTYMTAKSGPVKPEGYTSSEILNSSKASVNGRARASPLRRLLDPLLKSKVVSQTREHPNDLRMKPPNQVEVPENEKCEPSTFKALLHLTVKSGLPLFKFVVEVNNEILASTVKSLRTFGEDDMSWLYTFYSVNKVRKKSSGWTKQKAKPCGFSYSVVGQMKVSKPHILRWCERKTTEKHQVKESVLYSVDVNNANAATSELMAKRELAAIVVNVPDQTGKHDCAFSEDYQHEGFTEFEDEKFEQVVVILPGADHSLPHEGAPSSLLKRWRTGGLCDCGGWDEGCKLRVLTELERDGKLAINSRSRSTEVRCDLYDQGEARETKPFFRLVPFRDGLFSVEFDAKISSLQAFSICVAVISGKQKTLSSDATVQVESKHEFSRARAFTAVSGEGPEILSPHPPLSPVGRV